jgi:hypothetical protein
MCTRGHPENLQRLAKVVENPRREADRFEVTSTLERATLSVLG